MVRGRPNAGETRGHSKAAEQDRQDEFAGRASDVGAVFVSYSHKDGDVVAKLTSRLDRDEILYWLDARDLSVGAPIEGTLARAVRESCLLVVVLTPNSASSEWVRFEVAQAETVLPVVAKGLSPAKVPEVLGRNVLGVSVDPDFDVGYEQLRRAIVGHLLDLAFKRAGITAPA
jgi:hypothetical protein